MILKHQITDIFCVVDEFMLEFQPQLDKFWRIWNPWCFIPGWHNPTLAEILEAMEFHATKLVETKWERKWSLEIRKHLVQYLKHFPWVKRYRRELVTTESLENSLEVIDRIREEFKDDLDKKPSLWEIEKKEEI